MGEKEKNTYKYYVMQGNKVIDCGITYDFNRREAENLRWNPGTRLKQVGKLVTWEEGMKWQRRRIK